MSEEVRGLEPAGAGVTRMWVFAPELGSSARAEAPDSEPSLQTLFLIL